MIGLRAGLTSGRGNATVLHRELVAEGQPCGRAVPSLVTVQRATHRELLWRTGVAAHRLGSSPEGHWLKTVVRFEALCHIQRCVMR